MSGPHAVVLFLDGYEEEVRLVSAPRRDGYAYITRDRRLIARGATGAEAYEQLMRLADQSSAHARSAAGAGVPAHF